MEQNFHCVEGVSLKRPFQIRRLGHFGINVASVDVALDFYSSLLGFEISDELDFGPRIPEAVKAQTGPTRGVFTRHGTDHHSFVLWQRLIQKLRGAVILTQVFTNLHKKMYLLGTPKKSSFLVQKRE